jgi:hypothetical protein
MLTQPAKASEQGGQEALSGSRVDPLSDMLNVSYSPCTSDMIIKMQVRPPSPETHPEGTRVVVP